MTSPRQFLFVTCALLTLGACAGARPATNPEPAGFGMGPEAAKARARADSLRYPYTKGDIDFMTGMIHHHAQAITMSRWAPSHGAGAEILRLTARIINAQTDEINLMRSWLGDREQMVPTVDTLGNVSIPGDDEHAGHGGHGTSMPGMLTAEQMAQLDAARGAEFDRFFLTFMIQHHRGAITMVHQLFSTQGSGQDETIFKFAADVEADQGTEIKRMLAMLIEHKGEPRSP